MASKGVRSSHAISTTRETSLAVKPLTAGAAEGFSALILFDLPMCLNEFTIIRFAGFMR